MSLDVRSEPVPLLAKLSAVVGLGFSGFYIWFLAVVLYSLYNPTPGKFCGTGEVLALTAGAVVLAPIALLLLGAIALFRAKFAAQRGWQTFSWIAAVALLVGVGTNWLTFLPLLAP